MIRIVAEEQSLGYPAFPKNLRQNSTKFLLVWARLCRYDSC
jgi:hypothetical protein